MELLGRLYRHPDTNPSPLALDRMTRINEAFEQFEETCNSFR